MINSTNKYYIFYSLKSYFFKDYIISSTIRQLFLLAIGLLIPFHLKFILQLKSVIFIIGEIQQLVDYLNFNILKA